MTQVYHHYTAWEDWQAGMWQNPSTDEAAQAAAILSDQPLFLEAARTMLGGWPNAAEHNLTDLGQNRLAWIGQATCCHLAGVSEAATRAAWWTLTPEERDAANVTAHVAMQEWETARAEHATPSLFNMPTPRQPDLSERRTSA